MQLLWHQFRRLFLGTVVEALLETRLPVDLPTLKIDFDKSSEFRVPRLDNYMRFHGELRARLTEAPPKEAIDRLRVLFLKAWPDLLSVLDIPIGDRLTEEKNHLDLTVLPGPDGALELRMAFDLIAD